MVKITKEDFYKLKQLDRIEFRQRREYLDRNKIETGAVSFLWQMLLIIGFIMLVALSLYNINPSSGIRILMLLPLLAKLTGFGFIVLIFLDLYFAFKHKEKIDKLNEEYFDFNISVKNGKQNRNSKQRQR